MNKKEVIEMVSKLLKFAKEGEEVVPNPEPAKESEMEKVKMAAEAKTKDGLMLMTPAEKWEKDVEVFVLDENGENKPAEDNTYELEDGTKLVVEGGKVKEIMAIEQEVEETEEVEAEKVEQAVEMKLSKEEVDNKFAKLEEKFNKVLEAAVALTEAFSKLPVSDKINLSASSTSEEFGRKPISKKERNLKEIYSVLEEIRDEQNNKNKK